jgi:hypothetical protein
MSSQVDAFDKGIGLGISMGIFGTLILTAVAISVWNAASVVQPKSEQPKVEIVEISPYQYSSILDNKEKFNSAVYNSKLVEFLYLS